MHAHRDEAGEDDDHDRDDDGADDNEEVAKRFLLNPRTSHKKRPCYACLLSVIDAV